MSMEYIAETDGEMRMREIRNEEWEIAVSPAR